MKGGVKGACFYPGVFVAAMNYSSFAMLNMFDKSFDMQYTDMNKQLLKLGLEGLSGKDYNCCVFTCVQK